MTILEVLANAHYNLCVATNPLSHSVGKEQLNNVMKQLDLDKTLEDEFEEAEQEKK